MVKRMEPFMGKGAAARVFRQRQLTFSRMIMRVGVFLTAGAKGQRQRSVQ